MIEFMYKKHPFVGLAKSEFGDKLLGVGIEYQLFFVDLGKNIAQEVQLTLRQDGVTRVFVPVNREGRLVRNEVFSC